MSRNGPQAQKDVGHITRSIKPPHSTHESLSQRANNWHNVNHTTEKTRQEINTSITRGVGRAPEGRKEWLTRQVLDRYDGPISGRNVAKVNRSTYHSGRNARQRARRVCRPPYRLRRGIVTSPYTFKYGIAYVRYSVSETYIMRKCDVAMWRCSTSPRHSPCTWVPATVRDADEMSVTDSSPPTNTALALTAPAPTSPHRASESDGNGNGNGDMVGCGLEADGGIDDEPGELAAETALSKIIEVNDGFVQIGYANHLIILVAVAVLNETDVRPVKTGHILKVANRMTTEKVFNRPNVENSLKALYGTARDEVGFVDRNDPNGNAYDWFVTERGRATMALLYEAGIIEALAAGDLTADID